MSVINRNFYSYLFCLRERKWACELAILSLGQCARSSELLNQWTVFHEKGRLNFMLLIYCFYQYQNSGPTNLQGVMCETKSSKIYAASVGM